MIVCSKCHALNDDKLTECWNCNCALEQTKSYRKICTRCRAFYNLDKEICERCGIPLEIYKPTDAIKRDENSDKQWLYILSFLIPFFGIIAGYIIKSKGNNKLAKQLTFYSQISIVLILILIGVILLLKLNP